MDPGFFEKIFFFRDIKKEVIGSELMTEVYIVT
jgi:hypothetical protein